MSTDYSLIFDRFITKINDQQFLRLPEDDIEEFCKKYLRSAVTKFKNCNTDLTNRDDSMGMFYEDLKESEIEILSLFMGLEWLNPLIYNRTNLQQFLGDREYRYYSQANHIDKLILLRDMWISDVEREMISYSYDADNGLKNFLEGVE